MIVFGRYCIIHAYVDMVPHSYVEDVLFICFDLCFEYDIWLRYLCCLLSGIKFANFLEQMMWHVLAMSHSCSREVFSEGMRQQIGFSAESW